MASWPKPIRMYMIWSTCLHSFFSSPPSPEYFTPRNPASRQPVSPSMYVVYVPKYVPTSSGPAEAQFQISGALLLHAPFLAHAGPLLPNESAAVTAKASFQCRLPLLLLRLRLRLPGRYPLRESRIEPQVGNASSYR